MRVEIIERPSGPERLICEAALVFDDEEPLAGLRLVGFSVWRGANDEAYVSFPKWPVGLGRTRLCYSYLLGDDDALRRLKQFLVDAVNAWGATTLGLGALVLAPDRALPDASTGAVSTPVHSTRRRDRRESESGPRGPRKTSTRH